MSTHPQPWPPGAPTVAEPSPDAPRLAADTIQALSPTTLGC